MVLVLDPVKGGDFTKDGETLGELENGLSGPSMMRRNTLILKSNHVKLSLF